MRRRTAFGLIGAVLFGLPSAISAQSGVVLDGDTSGGGTELVLQSPVLVIDSQQLFSQSVLGQRIQSDLEAAQDALNAKNEDIVAELEAEELALTQKRAEMEPDEFRELAEAFDAKAQRIRRERAAELQQLGLRLEEERQAFLTAVVPVLEEMMREAGAAVVLEKRDVLLHVRAVDVTGLAIERVNQSLAAETPSE